MMDSLTSRVESRRQAFKARDFGAQAQRRRREEAICRQQQARRDLADQYRRSFAEPIKSKAKFRPWTQSPVCTPEWLLEAPINLSHDWYVLPRPEGKRCVILAHGGQTRVRARNGRPLCHAPTFRTALPGGGAHSSARGTTVLDGVVCEHDHNRIWVLDVMTWNDAAIHDCDTEFRFFWIREKLSEIAQIDQGVHEENVYFRTVPFYNADENGIRTAMDKHVNEEMGIVAQDGILFYMKQGHYETCVTPLVLAWKSNQCSAHTIETFPENIYVNTSAPREQLPLIATLRGADATFQRHQTIHGLITILLQTSDTPPVTLELSLEDVHAKELLSHGFKEEKMSTVDDDDDEQMIKSGTSEACMEQLDDDNRNTRRRVRDRRQQPRLLRVRIENVSEVACGEMPVLKFISVAGASRGTPDAWSRVLFQCRARVQEPNVERLLASCQ